MLQRKNRKTITYKFHMRKYSLKPESLKLIQSYLANFDECAANETLDLLLDEIESYDKSGTLLAFQFMVMLLQKSLCTGTDFIYCRVGFLAILFFSKQAFDTGSGSSKISSIQSLVGRVGRTWILCLISQLEDGHYHLEDLTGAVEINLSNAKITTGFFAENPLVLAVGEMLNGVFQVRYCGFPPLDDNKESINDFEEFDFFGGGTLSKEKSLRLKDLQASPEMANELFVILSDIWLDNEQVMRKLETVLNRYENGNMVPLLFVFMGNFCFHPCNISSKSLPNLRLHFEKLGQILNSTKS